MKARGRTLVAAVILLGGGVVAAGESGPRRLASWSQGSDAVVLPAGARVDVLLQTVLDSGTSRMDDRFTAVTLTDYEADGRVPVPAGAAVQGFVGSVRPSRPFERAGRLTLSFDEIRIDERAQRLRATVEHVLDGRADPRSPPPGGGLVARPPGSRGAGPPPLAGVVVLPDGAVMSTEAGEVRLPVGTILRIRLDQPVRRAGRPE